MYFEKIYYCIDSVKENYSFYKNLGANNVNIERPVIYINDVIKCVQKQKKGKAAGQDGLTSESIMYDTNKLFMYLTLFLMHVRIFHTCHLKL